MACVLDSSALLAVLFEEPGGQDIRQRLAQAVLSTVNWSEAAQKFVERGTSFNLTAQRLFGFGLRVEPFTIEDAERAATLRPPTAALGLSLGDRACLALAERLGLAAFTADRAWARLAIGIDVRMIR
ncbi:MAG: PIN domain-containing protein [Dehalococcoidia bacterium]|nr:PIN domain-containing protein [Dehalococcoidia bacterium]